VMLVNNDVSINRRWRPHYRTISAPVSGNPADTGSLGLAADGQYHAFDFWNQTYLGILDGNGAFSADLWSGEALVYAVRRVADHPQVVGTNRHIMCGMMELRNDAWDDASKTLTFTVDVIAGEPMCVTIASPAGSNCKAVNVTCDTAEVMLKQADQCVSVVAKSDESVSCDIAVCFE